MKTNLLLPYGFKKIGWVILIPAIVLGAIRTFWIDPDELFHMLHLPIRNFENMFTSSAEHWVNNILILGIVIGAFFAACSRERIEDELTTQLRQQALMLALWIDYLIVIAATLLVYDLSYVMLMTYNMMSFLVIFLAVFRYKIWRLRKEACDEE